MDIYTLMEQIHNGDKDAFRTFYSRYNKSVYRMAVRETNDQLQAVAVVKAVFQEIYQFLKKEGVYEGNLYTWLDQLTEKHLRLREAPQNAYRNEASYTEEAAAEITRRAAEKDPAAADVSPPKAPNKSGLPTIIALSLLSLVLIWVMMGMLGNMGVIPRLDLGYDWFNAHLYPLF